MLLIFRACLFVVVCLFVAARLWLAELGNEAPLKSGAGHIREEADLAELRIDIKQENRKRKSIRECHLPSYSYFLVVFYLHPDTLSRFFSSTWMISVFPPAAGEQRAGAAKTWPGVSIMCRLNALNKWNGFGFERRVKAGAGAAKTRYGFHLSAVSQVEWI